MGGRRWGRLASGFGAVGAVVAGVAVNQVGGDSAWPWQLAMAAIAAAGMWVAASLSHPSAAKRPVSPPGSADLRSAPDEAPASGATGGVARTRGGANGVTAALPVPRQLPADPAAFVGRETDLAALDALLARSGETRTVVVSAIAGSGGVGKTTLAVHWGHRVRERFPDGDLFVDLRGYDPGRPVTPEQALDGFLRALDVPAEKIPPELGAKAALFRSLLDGRQMLVVLDNAASVEQVRPLLPGTADCVTLITSRSRLSGLAAREGIGRVPIDVLSPEHAMDLLRRVIGDIRVDAEPHVAGELGRCCGYLPLALRIAADRAVTHPYLTLADLVDELVDEHDRLDVLASDDDANTAVRAVFSWSYKKLPPDAARIFRLLGLNAGPDLSGGAAAALTSLGETRVRRLLDTLTGQHLLEQTGRNRYRFHDLVRVYATERAMSEESEVDRSTAVRRLIDWYLHTALAARRVIRPHHYESAIDPLDAGNEPLTFETHDDALEWFERERHNLVAVVHQAAEYGHDVAAWKLAQNLAPFLMLSWYLEDVLNTGRIGLVAARRLGDQAAQALMLLNIGEVVSHLKRFEDAVAHNRQALILSRNSGAQWIEGYSQNDLGICWLGLRRFDEAVHHFRQALGVFRDVGERRGEGVALCNLGVISRELGRPEEAIAYHRQAISILEETADERDRAYALRELGAACYDLRRFDEAIGYHRQALEICREKKERRATALTLVEIGRVQLADHQTDAARRSWQEALAIFTDLDDPLADETKTRLVSLAADSPDA